MAKWLGFNTARTSLDKIRDDATQYYVLTSAIYTHAEIASHALVSANVSAADFIIVSAVTGPQLIVGAKNGQPITADGISNHLVLTNGSEIMYLTDCSARSLENGDTANIGSWTIDVLQSANNT